MEVHRTQGTLPAEYEENAFLLMVQSPNVLYSYWDLSPGLKSSLAGKEKLQIRLNREVDGTCSTYDIDFSKRDYYFSNVEPGLSYKCEIGIVNADKQFYPLLQSNSVVTPYDRSSHKNRSIEKKYFSSSSTYCFYDPETNRENS